MTTPTVFVCTATGTQGSAVARQLRDLDWEVHATTRDLESSAAKHLSSIGVEITQGGWNDETALKEAMAGCTMLFLNLMPDFTDFSSELRWAKRIISIAKDVGVRHIVQSSIITPEMQNVEGTILAEGLRGKIQIDQETRGAGFETWTILRPGYFMANLLAPKAHMMYGDAARTSIFIVGYRPDTVLPMIDHEDIAKFTVASFQDPQKFHEKEIVLAPDFRTFEHVVALMSKALGRNLTVRYLSDEEVEEQAKTNIVLLAHVNSRDQARLIDREASKVWGIPMGSFDGFLQRELSAFKSTYNGLTSG